MRNANYDLPDAKSFIAALNNAAPSFFAPNEDIFIARAPGRLDVMGGIADYSGSLVLEMPIAEAAFAAVQRQTEPRLHIISLDETGESALEFEMPLAAFTKECEPLSYAAARAYFSAEPRQHWAAYVAGVFPVLMRERAADFTGGAKIFIASAVPQGKGVSSSAALEAAAAAAICAAFGIAVNPRDAALLCQKVENLIVGAPCGVMDQMTVVCGQEDALFSMICQPAEILAPIAVPAEIAFWGIDSGIRHAVVGADYGSVRTGAFIGYRIIAEMCGLKIEKTAQSGVVRVRDDDEMRGYLANITPARYEEKFAAHLPQNISGADFLDVYAGITDRVTRVSRDRTYAVRHPTAHPIYENQRVERFARLLAQKMTDESLHELGSLMNESHKSYTACGLGSEGTDLLVELVEKFGAGKLFGAKITGGGSGGTVAVLGRRDAENAVRAVAAAYRERTGHDPHVFKNSSPGAAAFGTHVHRISNSSAD